MSRRMVSISCLRAWTMSEFERRSGTISGRSALGPEPATGRRRRHDAGRRRRAGGAAAAALAPAARKRPLAKSWVRICATSCASAYFSGTICSSFSATSTSTSFEDVEQPADVRRRVGDDEEVRLAVGRDSALGGHERAQQRDRVLRAVNWSGMSCVTTSSGGRPGRCLRPTMVRPASAARPRGDDPVQVAGPHRGQAVDVEDREQHREDVVARDAPGGLHRDLLAARARRQDVVEDHDLARGLEHDLDVGIVEVEDDELARGWADRRRRGRRARSGPPVAGAGGRRGARLGGRRRLAVGGGDAGAARGRRAWRGRRVGRDFDPR